jgi:GAF domain-containing protein
MDSYAETVRGKGQNEVLQALVEEVSRTMNVPASVWVPDDQGKILRIAASVGLPFSYVRGASLSLDEVSVVGEAFKTGEVTIARDILTDPRWRHRDEAQEMGWKSVLCVPIKAQAAVMGVICIYTFVIRDFSDLEIQRLIQHATQVSLATEADLRRATFSRLLNAGQSIEQIAARNPQEVFQEIATSACEVLGANCAILYPYDSAREKFHEVDMAAARGLQQPLQPEDRPDAEGLGAYVVRRGEIVRSDIEQQEPNLLETPFIAREGLKAFMGIALKTGERLLGLLYVGFRTPYQFSDEEQDTLRLFAHQAALAIDYSRLNQQATVRTETIKRLHDLAPTVVSMTGSPETLHTALKQIAQSALAALGADLIELYQYQESKDEYILPPIQAGERYDTSVAKDKIQRDDVLRDLVKKRRAQYSLEAQREPILIQPYTVRRPDMPQARFVFREDVKSAAVLPLLAGSEIVGVLFVNYRTPQSFPQQQRETIELFASQAALAIRHARQFERRVGLRDVARDLTCIKNKIELLENILQRSLALVGADKGGILLLEPVTDVLEYRYTIGKNPDQSVPLGKSLIGAAAKTLGAVRVGDVTKYARFVNHSDATASELDVPILVGNELLGVLNLESERVDAFDEDDEELATDLADLAAAALYHADLSVGIETRLEQRLEDIRLFQPIGEAMSRADLLDIVRLIAEKAVGLTGAAYGSIWLVDPSDTQLEIGALVGDGQLSDTIPPIPIDEHSVNGKVVLTGQSYLCPDTTQDALCKPLHEDSQCELVVALLHQGKTLGTLAVESITPSGFSQEDQQLLEAMADQAANAIYNARLIKRLEILAEVGRWWAQRDIPALPMWLRELVELRTDSSRIGAVPQVELLLRDGRRLAGAWESLNLLSGKQPLFEIAIRQAEKNRVIWVAADNVAEMDAVAAGRAVKLILGQLDTGRGDGKESQPSSLQ